MGLDMYLAKKTYVKNWDHMKPENKHQITVKKGDMIRGEIKPERISHIVEEVAYWRKANHIHQWFVENVQEDNDDCKEYYVSREKLEELLDTCKTVLAASKLIDGKISNGYTFTKTGKKKPIIVDGRLIEDPSVAKELLPTTEGFFFGSTDYDEYYFEAIQDTIEMLEPLLREADDGSFYYHSSW